MARMVADDKNKFTVSLSVPDGGLREVTASELNAGFQLCLYTLKDDFALGPSGSESMNEASLCSASNASTPGASNYEAAFTLFRSFKQVEGGVDDTSEVEKFLAAVKGQKGVEVCLYSRVSDKPATEPWEVGDEVAAAVRVTLDDLQPIYGNGFIKVRVPTFPQDGASFFTLKA